MSQWGDEQKRTAAAVFGGGSRPVSDQAEYDGVTDRDPEMNPFRVTSPLTNPKDALARATGKPRLDLLEPVANQATAEALAFGAAKYGVQNYITIPIHARVYLAAIQRHLDAWKAGEDLASDSGVHHLGHIAANVHVALAALAAGSFVDDRGPGVPVDASISDPAKVET